MISPSSVLAFAQASPPNPVLQFVPVVIIFAIFYFILIAPMRKRQKALQATIDNLKKGDRVVTTGGLHGEVLSVKSKTLVLKLADNLKVTLSKSAVAGLEEPDKDEG